MPIDRGRRAFEAVGRGEVAHGTEAGVLALLDAAAMGDLGIGEEIIDVVYGREGRTLGARPLDEGLARMIS